MAAASTSTTYCKSLARFVPHEVRATLLLCARDPECPLNVLQGVPLVWSMVFELIAPSYMGHLVDRDTVAFDRKALKDFHHCYDTAQAFPAPTGLCVNMMPIKLRDPQSLPPECQQYWGMIRACMVSSCPPEVVLATAEGISDEELHNIYKGTWHKDRIAYLTVHEGPVPAGTTQRRPGLHIERPAAIIMEDGRKETGGKELGGKDRGGRMFAMPPMDQYFGSAYQHLVWGHGGWDVRRQIPVDGIYMCSTVSGSTAVWPALINDPHEVSDEHGGIECLRQILGPPKLLEANEMCWITDRTPHESVALPHDTYRQFFRLVVGPISVWYSKHNTPNPLGVLPNAPISDADKFT